MEINRAQLGILEKSLDKLFKDVGIDVEFSRHFFDRLNDKRNGKPIEFLELRDIFVKSYKKFKGIFKQLKPGFEGVLNDVFSKLNIPFVIKYDRKNNEMDLLAKTIMRKADFKTSDPKLKVECEIEYTFVAEDTFKNNKEFLKGSRLIIVR